MNRNRYKSGLPKTNENSYTDIFANLQSKPTKNPQKQNRDHKKKPKTSPEQNFDRYANRTHVKHMRIDRTEFNQTALTPISHRTLQKRSANSNLYTIMRILEIVKPPPRIHIANNTIVACTVDGDGAAERNGVICEVLVPE